MDHKIDLMNPRTKAELFLLACTLIWGGTFVTVKSSLTDVSPLTLIALRFGIAAALFIPFCLSTLLKIDKPAALKGWMLGLLLFASFATQTIGLEYTSASKSGFITGMLVVFTPIFQLLIERRPPKLGNVIGVILVTLGLYWLTAPQGAEFNHGDGLTLLGAGISGLYIVYLDLFSKEHDVAQLTFMQMGVTVILAACGAALFERRQVIFSGHFLLALGYLSILATLLTLNLQTRYQKQTTLTRAGIIFSVEPLFSAVFAHVFGNEIIGGLSWLGGGMIVAGLIVSELSDGIFP